MLTIRQLSKLLGITSQMIRTYERYDLVDAQRDDSNYRRFSHNEIVKLLKCRRLLSFGFSTRQIRQMNQGVTYREMQGMLKSRADQLEEEIRLLVQKRNSITPVFNFMKDIHQKNGTCELITAPAAYCLPMICDDQLPLGKEQLPQLESWNKHAFAQIEVRRIRPEVLMEGADTDDIVMEYLINAKDAESIGVDVSLAYLRPECLCVRAYGIWQGELTVPISQNFGFAADFIRKNHLRITADPMIFLPFWIQEEEGMNYSVMEIQVERMDEQCAQGQE